MNDHIVKPPMNSSLYSRWFGPLGPVFRPSPVLQAQSCLLSLNTFLAHHLLVGQYKYSKEMAGVLGQAPILHFTMPELTHEHQKRMLHLGANASHNLSHFIFERVTDFVLIQFFVFVRHFVNLSVRTSVHILNILGLFNARVARVGTHNFFITVQQGVRLCHIVGIGCSNSIRAYQARLNEQANEGLHAKVPLFTLLVLMQLRVAFAFILLCEVGRNIQSGIYHVTGHKLKPSINQLGIDRSQNLNTKVVLHELVHNAQVGAFIRPLGAACTQVDKFGGVRYVMQDLFDGRVGEYKGLLLKVTSQLHLCGKRWTHRIKIKCKQGDHCQHLQSSNTRLRVDLMIGSNPVLVI